MGKNIFNIVFKKMTCAAVAYNFLNLSVHVHRCLSVLSFDCSALAYQNITVKYFLKTRSNITK